MNIFRLLLSLTLLMLLLTYTSCKKKKLREEIPEDPKVEEPEKKIFLPLKFESKSLRVSIEYKEGSSLISAVENSLGRRIEITYKNGLLFLLKVYERGTPVGFLDFQIANEKLINVNSWREELKLNISTGNYTFSYDSQNRISELHHYGLDRMLFKLVVFDYTPEQNLKSITTEEMNGNNTKRVAYSYDAKHGIFKDVKFFQFLFRELGYDFFYPTPNNPVSAAEAGSEAKAVTYSYLYNEHNYPSEISITKNKVKEVYQVSYMEGTR